MLLWTAVRIRLVTRIRASALFFVSNKIRNGQSDHSPNDSCTARTGNATSELTGKGNSNVLSYAGNAMGRKCEERVTRQQN